MRGRNIPPRQQILREHIPRLGLRPQILKVHIRKNIRRLVLKARILKAQILRTIKLTLQTLRAAWRVCNT